MGWIVFLVILISVISSLKKKWSEAKAKNQASNGAPVRQPPPLSKEEQVRQVRAEIQRKIQERLERGRQPVARAEPARLPPVLVQNQMERRLPQAAAVPPPLPANVEETLERQRVLADRIRELEARRQRIQENANAVTADSLRWDAVPEAPRMPARLIRDELRDVQSVLRAIVLREVLGTPVGLR